MRFLALSLIKKLTRLAISSGVYRHQKVPEEKQGGLFTDDRFNGERASMDFWKATPGFKPYFSPSLASISCHIFELSVLEQNEDPREFLLWCPQVQVHLAPLEVSGYHGELPVNCQKVL